MNPERKHDRELAATLSAMIDGTMSPTEGVRLGKLLQDHPDTQQAYLDLCLTHALLRQELGGFHWEHGWGDTGRWAGAATLEQIESEELPISPPAPFAPAPGRAIPTNGAPLASGFPGSLVLSYTLAVLMIAAGVIAAFAWRVSGPGDAAREIGRPTTPATVAARIGKVGRLIACRWADKAAPVRETADVMLGEQFAPIAGKMEILYDTGLTVALEGPATFAADSPYGGFLSRGRLTVEMRDPSYGAGVLRAGKKAGQPPAPQLEAEPSPSGAEPDSPPRFPAIIRTPTAVVTEADANFRVEAEHSGASVVWVSRGTIQLQLAGDGPERGVFLHGSWPARVEAVGIYHGITLAGSAAGAAVAATHMSREALARLVAGNSASGAAGGEPGWQFVGFDRRAVVNDARTAADGRERRPTEGSSVEIRGESRSVVTYRAEFEPCGDRAPAVKPRAVVSYIARGRLVGCRLNGKQLPGPWRASREAVQQFGTLVIEEGFREGINVVECDVLTDVVDPVKEPPLTMGGALFGFRQVRPAGAPEKAPRGNLQLESST